jgi:hypothetical protein
MKTIANIKIANPSQKMVEFLKKSQERKQECFSWMRKNIDKVPEYR